MDCLSCNRPLSEHGRWTDEDIRESRAATYHRPVRTSSGWTLYSPLSPTLVGKYRGHDFRPWMPAWRRRALDPTTARGSDLTGSIRA